VDKASAFRLACSWSCWLPSSYASCFEFVLLTPVFFRLCCSKGVIGYVVYKIFDVQGERARKKLAKKEAKLAAKDKKGSKKGDGSKKGN